MFPAPQVRLIRSSVLSACMSIPVICPGCKASFRVSDKFAGKTGPCPKCGVKIQVPEQAAEVKVHAPEPVAKDAKGRSVTKPLGRIENEVGSVAMIAAVGISLAVILTTWLMGRSGMLKDSPALLIAGLVLISPPLTVIGYYFLRDPDSLQPYYGRSLWVRGGICAAIYVVLWIGFSFIPGEFVEDAYAWLYLAPPFVIAGGLAALSCFDLPFGNGVLHYCFYLAVTMFLRYLADLPALWNPIT